MRWFKRLFSRDPEVVSTRRRLRACQTLAMASYLIQTRGWCQHRLYGSNGSMCAVGAIRQASRRFFTLGPVDRQLYLDSLQRVSDRVFPLGVATWNDQPWRTREQVIGTLREAGRWNG